MKDDGYVLTHLANHLIEAGRQGELPGLLLDYRWLRLRTRRTPVQSLIDDYDLLKPERNEPMGLMQGALQLSAHIVSRDPAQLPSQLAGRLLSMEQPELRHIVEQISGIETETWLCPRIASLTAPGGPLLRTLEGHTEWVESVAITPDGQRAVSVSDKTLRVWDSHTGDSVAAFSGDGGEVSCCAISADGRTIVAGDASGQIHFLKLMAGPPGAASRR